MPHTNPKVLLIDPPDLDHSYGAISRKMKPFAPTLGLAYIAAVLEENNIEIKLLDGRGGNMTVDEIRDEIIAFKPNIIGMTCLTIAFGKAIEIANLTKEISKDILVVMGGPHATPMATEIIQDYPNVDITVSGEGEYAMLDIVQGKDWNDIAGITFRKSDNVIKSVPQKPLIKDIDTYPFPARHLFNLDDYHQPLHETYGVPLATILTSRGCPYDCSFCSSKVVFTRAIRYRKVEEVVKEIDFLIDRYGIKGVKFADDTFSLKHERIKGILSAIKERNLYWIGNARVETLSEDLVKMFKETNCKLLQMGVESGHPKTQFELKKKENLNQTRKAFKWTNKYKLDSIAFFIFGSPSENWETVNTTMKFVKEIRPTFANFFILSPYPGTEMHTIAKKNDMMLIDDWTKCKSPKYEEYIIKHPFFSHDQLRQLQKNAYRQFYLNPRHIFFLLTRLNSFHQLRKYANLVGIVLTFIKEKKESAATRLVNVLKKPLEFYSS